MRFTVQSEKLQDYLAVVEKVVPSKATHPALLNVLVEASEGKISLTGFNLSQGMKVEFPANIDSPGAIAAPAKLFLDIIHKLPSGEVSLDTDRADAWGIKIEHQGGAVFEFQGMPATEFPQLSTPDLNQSVTLPTKDLLDGLNRVLFAVSADETKSILTGVNFNESGDSISFAATDGHRLSFTKILLEQTKLIPNDFEVTVPAEALRFLKLLISLGEFEEVTLQLGESEILFSVGGNTLVSRRLAGDYPPYSRLIPPKFEGQVSIEKKRLLDTLELLGVLSDAKLSKPLLMEIDDFQEQINFSLETPDVGKGSQAIPALVTGESMTIAFNLKYLMGGLKAIPGSELIMRYNSPTTPIIFSPVGDDIKMTYLVMPVQVRK